MPGGICYAGDLRRIRRKERTEKKDRKKDERQKERGKTGKKEGRKGKKEDRKDRKTESRRPMAKTKLPSEIRAARIHFSTRPKRSCRSDSRIWVDQGKSVRGQNLRLDRIEYVGLIGGVISIGGTRVGIN